MALVGYARVSSAGQSLQLQEEMLRAAGCEKIFAEKKSGRTATERPALDDARAWVREGDTLIVTRLDRLARSAGDLSDILKGLSAKEVGFKALQQDAVNFTSSGGRLMINMLAAFAEFENDLRRERQADGIAKAKSEGVYKGGKRVIDRAKLLELHRQGETPTAISKALKISRQSVYRLIEAETAGPIPG